ncbi:enoyl-CoA hydratase/isomerase family protein [soil metagenome]
MATLPDGDPVLVNVDNDGIATVTLNRPHAANAMDVPLLIALHRALLRCHRTPTLRVVVLTASGRHFCSGGDIRDFLAHSAQLPSHIKEVSSWLQAVTSAMLALEVPIIARVHGYAAGGGGLGLVGSSDFVIAGRSARFMSGAIGVGMVPDGGLTAILAHLVGFRKAMEIVMLNPTLDAEEALRIGLITRVVPDVDLDDEVRAVAVSLSRSAPLALAEGKRLLWAGLTSTVGAALPEEARAVVRLAGTADCLEGLSAVDQGRAAIFKGT